MGEAEVAEHQARVITRQAKAVWRGTAKHAVYVRDFAPFMADEPRTQGGEDAGPTPIEYVMGGLVACTAVILGRVAKAMRFTYRGLEVEAKGTVDLGGAPGSTERPPRFQSVTSCLHINTDEPDHRIQRLVELTEVRCPVMNLLRTAGVQLTVSWERASGGTMPT